HYYEKSGLNPDNAIAFTQLIQKHMFIPSPEIFGFKPIKEEKYNAIKNIITSKRKLNKIDKYFIVKR
ncbi:MAG: hypothetical protein LBC08_00200, partial [Campylobacteraceae bacterium]|nr:hypothetical protein [Campylobacteraceae bacterium]